jgi:hypothetical protein
LSCPLCDDVHRLAKPAAPGTSGKSPPRRIPERNRTADLPSARGGEDHRAWIGCPSQGHRLSLRRCEKAHGRLGADPVRFHLRWMSSQYVCTCGAGTVMSPLRQSLISCARAQRRWHGSASSHLPRSSASLESQRRPNYGPSPTTLRFRLLVASAPGYPAPPDTVRSSRTYSGLSTPSTCDFRHRDRPIGVGTPSSLSRSAIRWRLYP